MRILILMLLFISCVERQELEFFKVEKQDFDRIINKSRTPSQPDLAEAKTIINRDYPIEIALYEDGKWYYTNIFLK